MQLNVTKLVINFTSYKAMQLNKQHKVSFVNALAANLCSICLYMSAKYQKNWLICVEVESKDNAGFLEK